MRDLGVERDLPIDLEQRELASIHQDETSRSIAGHETREFGTDRSSRAGDQDRAAIEHAADARMVERTGGPREQILRRHLDHGSWTDSRQEVGEWREIPLRDPPSSEVRSQTLDERAHDRGNRHQHHVRSVSLEIGVDQFELRPDASSPERSGRDHVRVGRMILESPEDLRQCRRCPDDEGPLAILDCGHGDLPVGSRPPARPGPPHRRIQIEGG